MAQDPDSTAALGFESERILALVFDVDGTLYRHTPVKHGMLRRLLAGHILRPLHGVRVVRGLQAFRSAQESLRNGPPSADLEARQLEVASQSCGVPADDLREWVRQWMEVAPLDLVARSIRRGLLAFLSAARGRDLKMGVLSDYPAGSKLEALGVAPYFTEVVCAQDASVGAFKPSPLGLLRTCELLDCEPRDVLYIGDRPEVDGAAARAAGCQFALVGASGSAVSAGRIEVPGYPELGRRLF